VPQYSTANQAAAVSEAAVRLSLAAAGRPQLHWLPQAVDALPALLPHPACRCSTVTGVQQQSDRPLIVLLTYQNMLEHVAPTAIIAAWAAEFMAI